MVCLDRMDRAQDHGAPIVVTEREAMSRGSSMRGRVARVGLALASVILLLVGGWVLWQAVRERCGCAVG